MATTLAGKSKDLDGFSVTRILPHAEKRMVGPFIFFDHMGPAEFQPGTGIDVRPHPHIGLATITYMLEGSLLHRDSLGNILEIHPGDVNWMTAGRGIVHSERETHEVKASRHRLNGIQCWIALPKDKAEIEPSFVHIKKFDLPHFMKEGVHVRLIAGEACEKTSPIKTYSPMFYMDVIASKGKSVDRPNPGQECAMYLIQGHVEISGQSYQPGEFVLLDDDESIIATDDSRLLLLGGDPWDAVPRMYWNFVSFSMERIEQAKQDWREGRFPSIPSDHDEFTSLP